MQRRLLDAGMAKVRSRTGFTIVELLMVTVVIGVLVSITVVSYSAVTREVKASALKSDLANSSDQLKLYHADHGVYPTSLDINNCPVPADTDYCLKDSEVGVYNYSSSSPQTFVLGIASGSIAYGITDTFTPAELTMTMVRLTIDHNKVASNQNGFSVYLDLSTMPQQFWDSASSDGGDIRIYKADQKTELPREVVFIDSNLKTGEVWFKGDLSSSQNTEFYVTCGTGYVEYDINAIYGPRAVWGNDTLVYHLNDATPTTVADSGLDEYTGYKSVSNTPVGVSAKIGKGQSFDGVGSSGSININQNSVDVSQPHTYTAILKMNALPDYNDNGIVDRFQMATGSYSKGTRLTVNTGGYLKFENGYSASTSASQSIASNAPLSSGVFYFVSGVYDGTNLQIQINNTHKSVAKTASPISRSGTDLRIGNTHHSNGTMNGIVDEVRVFKKALAADTLDVMYANQLSPSTFYSSSYVN
jgi:prepilin-type N-terminal cleavage/methylation domain-containing protein